MIQATVSKDFSSGKYTDTALSVKAGNIINNMTSNTPFDSSKSLLQIVATKNTDYLAALNKRDNGGRVGTATKQKLRSDLESLLKQLASQVQSTAAGNEAMILSSGFEINKRPSTIGLLAKPTGVSLKMGDNKGSVYLGCAAITSASFYEYQYTEAPVTDSSLWIQKNSTKSKVLIDSLTSGKQYVFRVAAAGSTDSRIWSDEIISYVL